MRLNPLIVYLKCVKLNHLDYDLHYRNVLKVVYIVL